MSAPGPDLRHSPSTSSTHSHESMERRGQEDPDQCTDISQVFPGDWNAADEQLLMGLGWSERTAEQKATWYPAVVPYWTRKEWDPSIEVTIDGKLHRRARGDMDGAMRPAILERDKDIARTEYTKRWGINPLFPKTDEGLARSGLTPLTAAPDPPAPRQWTHEESWQTWWFDGFTSQELTDTGAYAPGVVDMNWSDSLSQRPDELLHPLFERSRWTQPRSAEGLGGDPRKTRIFDLAFDLNGIQGRYDAKTNDDVWAALRPSMQLASLIINSGHPTFNMFLGAIYHMRRVPMRRDGRTNKAHPLYRQYQALWHEIDEGQMYFHARELKNIGFDAAWATLANLQKRLKWCFNEVQPNSNGSTTQDNDGSIHIFMSANNLWPLLSDQYTEGEKLPMRLKIASTMLHELCHACHLVHHNFMEQPELSLRTADMAANEEIVNHLKHLRREALGDGDRNVNGRNYFIEDDIQMEEGKAFEDRLWGHGLEHWPLGRVSSRLRPMVAARDWPWGHPQVFLQNPDNFQGERYAEFTELPYKAFLLSPRAGVYDLYTPLPVSNYSRLFDLSWWRFDFQRYGYAAIKNVSSTQADQSSPLQSRVVFRYNSFRYIIAPLVGNNMAVLDFFVTGTNILTNRNHHIIAAWLNGVGREMAAAKIMRLRLHYERKTWDLKYNGISGLCQDINWDIQTASQNVRNEVSGTPMGEDAFDHLNTLIRVDLPELHRLMDYEGRYSQGIAAEYFLKDIDDRRLVRRSMHILLLHLQTIHSQVENVQKNMMPLWSDMGGSPAFTKQVEDCEAVYRLLTTAQTAVSSVIGILTGNTLDQREGTHGPLAGSPVSQRELRLGRNLRIAALREFTRIEDPRLKRLIQTWINLIQATQDIRLEDPSAEDYVVGGGTTAELKQARDQAIGDALAITLLERQDQAQASWDAGRAPDEGEDAAIKEIQQAMSDVETASGIVDLYAAFSDEEKEQIRHRTPSP